MGRKAKYLTLEDRKKARSAQRIALSQRPHKAMRQAQNRRQYLRVKPPPILTGSLRRHSESRITWSEWITVHARFLQGDDEVSLDKIQLQESDIRALVGTPSHHTSLTSLRPFDDVWGPVSAAMHGYLSRLYIQEAEERADRIKRGTPATAREELWSLFSRLSSQRKALMGALGSGPMNRYTPEQWIIYANLLWISRSIKFAAEDLGAFTISADEYLRTCSERLWRMGQITDEML